MKPFRLAALSLALLTAFSLTGCDDSGTPQASAPAPAATAKPDRAQLAALAEKSQGKALTLLDASEVQLDGAATLVLTFSVPLQPDQDFSRSVHLVDKKSGKVDGAWELAPNLKELRLRHLEPKRELIVSVDPTLTALNKATLDKPFEKTLTTRDIAPSVGFASRGSLLPGNVVAGLPVMALKTRVAAVRAVPAGTCVSYGCTARLERDSRLAVLPVGYGDGYPRLLSNRMEVLLRGRRCPVVGRICMDMCMVDVTDVPDAVPGDVAELYGREGLLEQAAALAGTIPYELLCNVNPRVPRIYTGRGGVTGTDPSCPA